METGGIVAQPRQNQSVLMKYPLLSAKNENSEDMLFTGLDDVLIKVEEMHVDLYRDQQIQDLIWELT